MAEGALPVATNAGFFVLCSSFFLWNDEVGYLMMFHYDKACLCMPRVRLGDILQRRSICLYANALPVCPVCRLRPTMQETKPVFRKAKTPKSRKK